LFERLESRSFIPFAPWDTNLGNPYIEISLCAGRDEKETIFTHFLKMIFRDVSCSGQGVRDPALPGRRQVRLQWLACGHLPETPLDHINFR
jgi:hypothetical protein